MKYFKWFAAAVACIGIGMAVYAQEKPAATENIPPAPPAPPKVVQPSAPAVLPRNNSTTPEGWTDDIVAALDAARRDNKAVLLLFTGSDWCGWCKKLKKETLMGTYFKKYARAKLVLVYLDMPQNGLTQNQLKTNEKLMKQYCGERAGFPTSVVLDSSGRKLGMFSGYAPEKDYVKKINKFLPKKK